MSKSEVKPKELWLREEYKNDKYEFFSCEIATRKPNLESHNESDFKDALHVIEYSAYEKLKAQLEKAEATLKLYADATVDLTIFISHPYDDLDSSDFDIIEEFISGEPDNFGERAREYFKEKGSI